ncbi:MAG: hypothetical protein ACREF8_07460 [Chthoniobacterales bacterium]
MKQRYELAGGFRQIAQLIRHTSSPRSDVRTAILADLRTRALFEECPADASMVTKEVHGHMLNAFIGAVEAMRDNRSPADMLTAFEKAVHFQSAYYASVDLDRRAKVS